MSASFGAGPAGLVLEGVAKRFVGSRRTVAALEHLDLSVERGRFVTVIGPSGCGKSTLLRIAAGLLEPDEGTVAILGETVERARRAKQIGFVPQAPALLAWRTVRENVELMLAVNRQPRPSGTPTPVEILASFGLGDALDRHPGELSGGMQQRVAIARAFTLAPAVLLMDEPFSAVDELTRDVLRHELVAQWEQHTTTVLFVTHSVPESVLLSDRVVVMSEAPGRIAASIEVDLPRPRVEGIEFSDAFRRCELEVRAALREVWRGAR